MKHHYLLLAAIITTGLFSCGKGGSSPSPDNGNNNNTNNGNTTTTTSYTVSTLVGNGLTGNVDGPAANAEFTSPDGITNDASGNLFVTDGLTIRKVTTTGVVTTIAGSAATFGATDGTGANASFTSPGAIVTDASGNMYVCDRNIYKIRKVTPTGVVTTFAGNGVTGNIDGPAATAEFQDPRSLTIDAVGNLYVADINSIRKITPTGVVSTFVQGSYVSLAADGSGNIFAASVSLIKKITPAGVTSAFAGSANFGYADGTGTNAMFLNINYLMTDSSGNLYVSDWGNFRIRKITPTGVVTTFAGSGTMGFADGALLTAQFNHPTGIVIDAAGNFYITDSNTRRIRKITKQ